MMRDSAPLLGLSMDPSADFRARPTAKNAGLFAALDRRYGVSEVLRPEVPWPWLRLHQLRHIHPARDRWRRGVNLDPRVLRARSAEAERLLRARDGQYRLIVQLHTLVSPGISPGERPFVLHTDTTLALTLRHAPAGTVSHRRRVVSAWMAQERAIYQAASFLFPRSEWLRRSLIDDYGCDPGRVIRVGGGSNLPLAPASALVAARWQAPVALFVGLDLQRKGGAVLLEAWPRVRRVLPQARLQVVGVQERPRHLPEGVEWLGVVADRARLLALYDGARVFVMPSLYEPWGHVFYEAMGRGAACIGAQTCAMPEILAHGAAGLLVACGDRQGLADALVRLLGDAAEAERLGRAGHAQACAQGTWDDVVSRMAPALDTALARSGG